MDSHSANPDPLAADTHMSRCWRQEWHLAGIHPAPLYTLTSEHGHIYMAYRINPLNPVANSAG